MSAFLSGYWGMYVVQAFLHSSLSAALVGSSLLAWNVRDPAVKAQIEIRLSQLRDEAYAEAFRRVNEEFEQRRKDEFPYVPPTLYFFVADPVEGALGLEDEG